MDVNAVFDSSQRRLLDAALGHEDPVVALVASRDLRESLAEWESTLARRALADGATWEAIGAAPLGISRQAAWERLRPRVAEQIAEERGLVEAERERVAKERAKRLKGNR